jgi:hypothetical protein
MAADVRDRTQPLECLLVFHCQHSLAVVPLPAGRAEADADAAVTCADAVAVAFACLVACWRRLCWQWLLLLEAAAPAAYCEVTMLLVRCCHGVVVPLPPVVLQVCSMAAELLCGRAGGACRHPQVDVCYGMAASMVM